MADKSLDSLLYDIRRIEEHREYLTDKKIKSMYTQLMDDLDLFIAKGYKKYADADGRLYVANLEANRKRAWFLNEVMNNVDTMTPKLQKEISTLVNTTYEECYKGIVEATKKAATAKELKNIAKELKVNPETLKQAVNNNISKLTLPAVMEKHRAETIYKIQQELNIGLMNGDRYENMAKRIENVLIGDGLSSKGAQGKAMNIVRTESHRNVEDGLMDGAKQMAEDLLEEGYIYAATWKTRKDERVRPQYVRKSGKGWKRGISKSSANHVEMHGKTVKVGEKFEFSDGATAENPGNSGEARHDCNCRCFLVYNIMTPAEFAKATNQSEAEVMKKYMKQSPKVEDEKEITKVMKSGKMRDLSDDDLVKYSGTSKSELKRLFGDTYKDMSFADFADDMDKYSKYIKTSWTRQNFVQSVKGNSLTKTVKTDKIELPKSLENFDEYQEQWVKSHFLMPKKDMQILQDGIQEVIDNNAYSMRVNAKDLQSIINGGFKNQFETKTSGGTLSKRDRMTASYRLFGNEATKMADNEFEKYGYLGSKDFVADYKSSATGQYGKTIVKFRKDKLTDRVTYTVDDSLGNALYNEVIGGKIGDECSISGVPLFNTDDLLEYFKNGDWNDIDNADEIAQLMGCRYWEIQFHGNLTIDDVESVCFTKTDRNKVTDEMVKQLKDHGVKVYEIKGRGNDLHEL